LTVPSEWEIEVDGETQKLTAKDFLDFVKLGQTITAHGDIEGHTIGKVADTTEKKSFGQKSEIKGGFTIVEWTLKGADIETPYDTEDIKQIKKEYDIYLDATYKQKLEQQKEYNAKKNGSGATTSKGLGSRSTTKSDGNPFTSGGAENPFA